MCVIPRNRLKREFFPKGVSTTTFEYAMGDIFLYFIMASTSRSLEGYRYNIHFKFDIVIICTFIY